MTSENVTDPKSVESAGAPRPGGKGTRRGLPSARRTVSAKVVDDQLIDELVNRARPSGCS